jgi:Transglycosylase SLT domain.
MTATWRTIVLPSLLSCLFLAMPSHVSGQAGDRGDLAARCIGAARAAEAIADLPDGLLVAVAVVESALHPYAVGSDRDALYARSTAHAKAAARTFASAARSVSGGCFQVNIGAHARDGAAWVFDPVESAMFAARLLVTLHARHGGWAAALAAYNGAAPGSSAGHAYACRVRAALAEIAPASLPAIRLGSCPAAPTRAIRAKAATLLELAGAADDQLAEAR